MTTLKRFRLWLKANGEPLYVEVLDGALSPDSLRQVSDQIAAAKVADKPLILGSDWELRVLI